MFGGVFFPALLFSCSQYFQYLSVNILAQIFFKKQREYFQLAVKEYALVPR